MFTPSTVNGPKVAPTVTQEEVDGCIKSIEVKTLKLHGFSTTLVSVQLDNGFILNETAKAVCEENYSEEIGKEICLAKIKDKIWFLRGYLLAEKLYQERLKQ